MRPPQTITAATTTSRADCCWAWRTLRTSPEDVWRPSLIESGRKSVRPPGRIASFDTDPLLPLIAQAYIERGGHIITPIGLTEKGQSPFSCSLDNTIVCAAVLPRA